LLVAAVTSWIDVLALEDVSAIAPIDMLDDLRQQSRAYEGSSKGGDLEVLIRGR
jgi:hypothetical protein